MHQVKKQLVGAGAQEICWSISVESYVPSLADFTIFKSAVLFINMTPESDKLSKEIFDCMDRQM